MINVEAPSALFSLPSMEDQQEAISLVSTVKSAEVVTTVSYAQTMAKLLSVAGVFASEPLALTAASKIAKKEIKRLDREIGFDPLHSADFFLSLLGEMELLVWVDHGQDQRIGLRQGCLSDLMEKDGLTKAIRTSLGSPFEFLNPRAGDDRDPLSLKDFYYPTEDSELLRLLQHRLWWMLQAVLSRSVPVGTFFDLDELCRNIVEALPPWVLGSHAWSHNGKDSWVVCADGESWAIFFFQSILARMMLRLGFIELGVHPGDIEAADRAKATWATCPPPLESWNGISFPGDSDRLRPRTSGILARTTPAWAWIICNRAPEKAAMGGSIHIGGDLEIHADLEVTDFNRSILLYLAVEDLPAAPGDRIRRFRMTQRSVGRALLAGASKESIRELVEASQPPAPESVRRRIEEWLRSIGALTLYGGWILGEWKNKVARDAAVLELRDARPVGELWALLPPKELDNVRIEVLPAPLLRLDGKGSLVLSTSAPKAAEKALSIVASPQADHRLSFDASTIKSMNLTSSRVAKALSYWSADPKQLREFLDHEIRRLSGVMQTIPWWEGRVAHVDSAPIARKICAALIKGGKPALDLGGGAVLALDDFTSLRKIAKLEGFKLEKAEDFSKLPSALGGSAHEEGARGRRLKRRR